MKQSFKMNYTVEEYKHIIWAYVMNVYVQNTKLRSICLRKPDVKYVEMVVRLLPKMDMKKLLPRLKNIYALHRVDELFKETDKGVLELINSINECYNE
ncbi:orf96 [Cryptophlebia peltastica nucleopolyhedrovirus]|uniref:Orf96 n=1 Tax=Cryptophlebia peltastica nucleopolyhedrovirus TaxID=2304025 RepID=A0A346RNW5_9ABAC|nr:orf96 [Cryptophlebia peltastica nucleopolyhedrovirus]AXS67762.1 orf96 [Cryptophlebia peltastica nucleopolyhedrovirus]